MAASPDKCRIKDIPRRLHTRRRSTKHVSSEDFLYIRHPPLPAGQPYVGQIEGFRLQDQSGNSQLINVPHGEARDVLFNTKNGDHYVGYQIAKLPVAAIRQFKYPNASSVRYKDGRALNEPDEFTFDVRHVPTPCMYPHCVIRTAKNGTDLGNRRVAEGVRTAIRIGFAELAERNREEMLRYLNTGLPKHPGRRRGLILVATISGIYVAYRLLRLLLAGN
jgi:hypothetical protein